MPARGPVPAAAVRDLRRPRAAPCLWPLHPVHPDQRLRQLLDDGTGRIRAELRVLHQTLASADRPRTVLGWLSKNAAAAVLASLARGERPLTHHALDQMPPSKPVEHLRASHPGRPTGALPARDEHLTRLEHWIDRPFWRPR